MKFDFLDIKGKLRIKGNAGFSGAAPSFNSGTTEWLLAGIGGSTYSILGATGYNYIIVGATGTPTENAQRLIDSQTTATLNWSGGQSINNRFTLLLSPGIYDFVDSPFFPTNYIDLIGISSNPYHSILTNTLGNEVIIVANGYDCGLENVYLPGNGRCNTQPLSYVRWKNVVVGGNTFDSLSPWTNVNGKFKNIFVENGADFASSLDGINATFENIIVGTSSNLFVVQNIGDIIGTFSNIKINSCDTGNVFSTNNGSIYGSFDGIEINEINNGDGFKSQTDLIGNFENIVIDDVNNGNLFFSDNLSGTFKNISIGNLDGFGFSASNLFGEYKNIEVNSVNDNLFRHSTSGSMKLKNIQIGKVVGNLFTTVKGSNLDLEVENLKTDEVRGSIFQSDNINGTFSNLEIGPVVGEVFVFSKCNLNLKDYKITASASSVFDSGGTMSIYSYNGFIENASNFMTSLKDINCVLKNTKITFSDGSNNCITAADSICGTISNFVSNDTGSAITSNRIYGSYKDMQFGNILSGSFFKSSSTTDSINDVYFRNVKAGNISGDAFNGVVAWGPTIRNVSLGNCDSAFNGGDLNCTIDNVSVGSVTKSIFVGTFSANQGTLSGTFRDVTIGNVGGDAFRAWFNQNISQISLSGIFKNISIQSALNVFKTSKSFPTVLFMNNARIENLFVGTSSTVFDAAVKENVRVRNLKATSGWTSQIYQGSLENSYINSLNKSFTVALGTNSVISRSVVISPVGTPLNVTNGFHYLSSFNQVSGLTTPTSFTNSRHNTIDPLFS